jgi:hypothetical protein
MERSRAVEPSESGPLHDAMVMEELLGWVYRHPTSMNHNKTVMRGSNARNHDEVSTVQEDNVVDSNRTDHRGIKTKSAKRKNLPTVSEEIDELSLSDFEDLSRRTMVVGFRSATL